MELTAPDRAWLRAQIRQTLRSEIERLEAYRRDLDIPEAKTLTVTDVCAILQVSQTTLRLMREEGKVQFADVGGNLRTTWGRLQQDIDRMFT